MNRETPLERMRRFYNRFPYPGRSLFLFPYWRHSWLSHAGFALLCARRPLRALELWRMARGVESQSGTVRAKSGDHVSEVASELSSDKRLLLVGCGTDEPLLFRLLHPRNPLVGIDLSARSLARARARLRIYRLTHPRVAPAAVEFHEGDATAILNAGHLGTFDFIQCFGVLHHQPDAQPLLASMSRVLASGGFLRLMIYAHHGRRLERRLQRRFLADDADGRLSLRQSWRLWFWQMAGFLGFHRPMFRRFRYIGTSRRAVADAFLHPSDPGLPLERLLELSAQVGLTCRFCEAKIWNEGWVAAAGDCSALLNRLAVADRRGDVVSNIILIFQKNEKPD
jgi:SAM-dependent methyltransferase